MDWGKLFGSFWDLIYSALVNAVSLNWSALVQIGEDIRTFWDNFLVNIIGLFDATYDYIHHVKSNLVIYIDWVVSQATDAVVVVETYVTEQIQYVIDWVQDQLADIAAYVEPLVEEVKDWVQGLLVSWLQLALDFINPYIETAKQWVMDTFGWLLEGVVLLTEWLVSVRDAITWLATEAWQTLVAFFSDPVGFVLGALLGPLMNVINWWSVQGQTLDHFIGEELPALRALLSQGLTILQEFVSDPRGMILLLLEDVFLDWLERLIADNW